MEYKFPSPCGDKLHNHWTHGTMPTSTNFRPLVGIVPTSQAACRLRRSFRPLTGIVPPCCSAKVLCASFRPLTGIVPRSMTTERLIFRFRPLAGINCNKTMLNTVHMDAMFPSPDGAKSHAEKEVSNMTYEQVIVPLRGVVLLYHTLSQKKRTIHRRSADGAEKIRHTDHLDSAEGASKP